MSRGGNLQTNPRAETFAPGGSSQECWGDDVTNNVTSKINGRQRCNSATDTKGSLQSHSERCQSKSEVMRREWRRESSRIAEVLEAGLLRRPRVRDSAQSSPELMSRRASRRESSCRHTKRPYHGLLSARKWGCPKVRRRPRLPSRCGRRAQKS